MTKTPNTVLKTILAALLFILPLRQCKGRGDSCL